MRGGRGSGDRRKTRRGSRGRVQGMQILKQRNFSIEQLGPHMAILRARKWTKAVYEQVIAFMKTVQGRLLVDNEPMSKKAALRYIISRLQTNNAVHIAVM